MFNFSIKLIITIHTQFLCLPGHLSPDIFGSEEFCYLIKCLGHLLLDLIHRIK